LTQKGKIRPIDNLKESGVNAAYGSHDKLVLHDVDSLAAVVRLVEKLLHFGKAEVNLRSGTNTQIVVHKSWLDKGPWVGKTADLKSAYKQFCIAPSQLWSAVICTYSPETKCAALFTQYTLPFGACGAVLHFNRMARLLWCIGAQCMTLLWTNFFDDYPTISAQCVCKAVQAAIGVLFKVLGWQWADGPDKDKSFAQMFDALGITLSIGRMAVSGSSVEQDFASP
jgi:hypothetical protein